MNRGAFDFITKPVNFNDLELTMEKTIKHVEPDPGNHSGHQGKQHI